jgi:hypothetical protein
LIPIPDQEEENTMHRRSFFRASILPAIIMALMLIAPAARAHCPEVSVNVDPSIECRIHICIVTPSGRFCDTVIAGTTRIPVIMGVQVDDVIIDSRLGPISIPAEGCVDNIPVGGCCIKVCRHVVPPNNCTVVDITPATGTCP